MTITSLLNHAKELKNIAEMPLNVLNDRILLAEENARKDIENVKAFQDQFPRVNANYDEASTMANYIKDSIGLYIKPNYVIEFNAYTSRFHAEFLVHYAIRDNFYGYFIIIGAEIGKDSICFKNCCGDSSYKSPFNRHEPNMDYEIIKECKNCNLYVKKTDDLVELVTTMQGIESKYNKVFANNRGIK